MTSLIIPVGGLGSRFSNKGYKVLKPLIPINGVPMLLASVLSLNLDIDNYYFAIRKFDGYEDLCSSIKKSIPNSNIYLFDKVTEGPAITVKNTIEYFNISDQVSLYTANCDQVMRWNGKKFQSICAMYDGVVVTFEGGTEAHSFISLDIHGNPIRLTEKQKISNIALTGIHYWKKTLYFLDSVKNMIADNNRAPNGEFYIAPSYNYMIKKNQDLGIHHIPKSMFCPVGTPEDLEIYLNENF